MPDLNAIVASLRSEGGTGLVRRRVDPLSPVDVYLGIDADGTQIGVVLAVPHKYVPAQKDLPSAAGFAVRTQSVKGDPKGFVSIGVFCIDPVCEDIFHHFMEDLVLHLLDETGPEPALKTFLARVAHWQHFFVAGGVPALTLDAQCGLYGELLLLRDVLIPRVGPSVTVDSWKGPDGSPQDFRLPQCALEVKCSRAKAGAKIPISNEQQLDERPFPHLALVHIQVTLGSAPNDSLGEMITSIRLLLAATGRPLKVFNDQLITYGWIDARAELYRENRFFVNGLRYFEVKGDFPRIRPSDVPLGVGDITYKLDPASLVRFEITQVEVEGWLQS